MNGVLQWHTTDAVWQHVTRMTMHNAVDVREALVDLAVDMALDVARLRVLLDSFGGLDVVFDEVVWRTHQSWWHVARHPKGCSIIW